MPDWFADDAFWTEIFPFEFSDATLTAGEAQVDNAIRLAGVSSGTALDLGCGPGRHAVALATRRFRVTAVDLSAFYLTQARERATAAGVTVELVRDDMRSFVRPEAFDLVLSLFTSFGYFEDEKDDLRVLENIRRSLRPRGVLVIDLLSKERLAKVFQPTQSQQTEDGALLVKRLEIVDDWTRVKNEYVVIRGGRVRTFEFTLRMYSGKELKQLLHAAGFSTFRLHGDLDGRPYGQDVNRLVAVATK